MNQEEAQTRTKELEQQIAELPVGSITRKTVNGKIYFYQRWSENGKRREKYIPLDEVDAFREQIEHRKTLEQEIKALRRGLPKVKKAEPLNFITNVRTGNTLRTFADAVSCYQKRECFQQLHDYVYGETRDKVFILYGLRRTGKTTMIRQIFADMAEDELAKAAFIQITAKDTLADVNKDLKTLEQKGFRYVFLDEVTLMEDFIEGAALFSDVFATCGIAIPSFISSVLLLYEFGMNLKLLPTVGLNSAAAYIMPVTALAIYPSAYITRLMRSSLLDVMGQDYMRTARAKGVSQFMILFKHALRNAILPVITYVGPMLASLMTGSFVVEKIFSVPGLGRDFVSAITNRDYTLIMGTTILLSSMVIIANVVVDILYKIIDPRIKLQ